MKTRPGYLLMRLLALGAWLMLAVPATAQPGAPAVVALRPQLATIQPDITPMPPPTTPCYNPNVDPAARARR